MPCMCLAVIAALVVVGLIQKVDCDVNTAITDYDTNTVTDYSVSESSAVTISFTQTDPSANYNMCWSSDLTSCATSNVLATGGSGTFTFPSAGSYGLFVTSTTPTGFGDYVGQTITIAMFGGTKPLTVVSATANNLYTGISPISAVAGSPTTFSLTGTSTDAVKVHLATSCSSVDFKTTGTSIAASVANPSFSQTVSGGPLNLCVQREDGSDSVAQSSVTVSVTLPSVYGDPVAHNGIDRVKFWLPLGAFMPLLRTADLDVWGRTRSGLTGSKSQFIDRYIVSSRGGLLVDVNVRDVLHVAHVSTLPSTGVALLPTQSMSELQFLDVNVIEGESRAYDGLDDGWMQVQGLRRNDGNGLDAAMLPHESIEVLSSTAHFSVALGYTIAVGNGTDDLYLYEHTHLDLQMHTALASAKYTGIFPELWGLRKPSACTSLLKDMQSGPEDGKSVPAACFKFDFYDQQKEGTKGCFSTEGTALEL